MHLSSLFSSLYIDMPPQKLIDLISQGKLLRHTQVTTGHQPNTQHTLPETCFLVIFFDDKDV